MTAYACELEIKVSNAANTTPRMVRFYVARLLAEIDLERRLNPEEAKILGNKIYASFPRIQRKHREIGDTPATAKEAHREIQKALERSGLGSDTPQVTHYSSPMLGEIETRDEPEETQSHDHGSVAGDW